MTDCLFCKIIQKEIPAESLYEDDDMVAILDIHPVNPGHTLVIPKQHSEGLHDAEPSVLQALIIKMPGLARAVTHAVGAEDFNVHQNNGKIAGQAISHLHFHVIPRHADDGLHHWPSKAYQEGEADEILQKIRDGFSA